MSTVDSSSELAPSPGGASRRFPEQGKWLRPLERYGSVIAAIVTIGAILGQYVGKGVLFKQYDDAYITFRYAANLSRGQGLVFNAGEATDSASSISYTLLLALCHRLGLENLPLVATVIGLISAGGIAAVVYATCLRRTWRPVLSLLLAVAAGCHGLISGWAVSGMETVPFAFLVTLAVRRLFFVRSYGWLETALVGLILWTRLEGILLALAWAALGVPRFASRQRRRGLLVHAGCLAALGLAFVSLKLWLYGALVPHAFHLQQITTLYAPKPSELWAFWSSTALALVMLAVAGLTTLPKRFESLVLLAYVAVSAGSVATGPYSDSARYSAHLLPICVMLASVPLSVLWSALPALGACASAILATESRASMSQLYQENALAAGHQACRLELGCYLQQHHRPSDGYVISSDIGAIAYAAPSVRFIDAVGLTSADILKAHAGGESTDSILLQKRPTIIADTCKGDCLDPGDFSSEGWFKSESYWLTALGDDTYSERLREGKLLFRCESPDGLGFGATRFTLEER